MATLFGIFEVGARGLASQQAGLNITGHNIANANTEGYSRQRVNFTTTNPLNITPGALPTGVRVDSIERMRDEFLDFQIRTGSSLQGFYSETGDVFDELQVILQDPLNPIADLLEENPAEAGLNGLLSRFFGAFQELASNPESTAVRAAVRETAITLTRGFNTLRSNLDDLSERINGQIQGTVTEINSILHQVGQINEQIARIEAGSENSANDFRDLRDQLLTELSEIVPISTTEQPNGTVDVRVLGTAAVVGNRVSPFEAVVAPDDLTGTYQIINSVEQSRVLNMDIDTGRLGALLQARDELLPDFIAEIDQVAQSVIREVNRIQSESIGLDAFTSLTGSNAVSNATIPIDQTSLDFPPQAGSFNLRVVNAAGEVQNLYGVSFDPAVDSLTDLAARIDAIDGVAGPGGGAVSATVTADNRLEITTNGGLSFTFQGDTSNVVSALGLNNFFSGTNAKDIRLSDFILDGNAGLRRIGASSTGAPGDNGGALALAGIQNGLVADNNTTTIGDSYRRIISQLGVQAQRNRSEVDVATRTLEGLQAKQESVSGVSLDEESVNLIRFQQAFSAAARYITTVDSLIDRVVNGMGVTR